MTALRLATEHIRFIHFSFVRLLPSRLVPARRVPGFVLFSLHLLVMQCCGSGSGAFLTSGSGIWIRDPGWNKNPDPGRTSRIIFPELRKKFWVINTSIILCGPGYGIRDPEFRIFLTLHWSRIRDGKFGSGIRDNHPGSATLNCYVKVKRGPLLYNCANSIGAAN